MGMMVTMVHGQNPRMCEHDSTGGGHCTRCGGLLRNEYVRRSRVRLRACMACGDRTDETILANRRCMVRQEHHDWKTSLWNRIRMLAAMEQVPA